MDDTERFYERVAEIAAVGLYEEHCKQIKNVVFPEWEKLTNTEQAFWISTARMVLIVVRTFNDASLVDVGGKGIDA